MWLIVHPGTPDEHASALSDGETTIGRTEENTIRVVDRSLSRQHARLEIRGEQAVLADLESKNGTFVGGGRVTRQALRPGDRFRCGDVTFELALTAPSRPQAMPTIARKLDADFTRDTMGAVLDALSVERSPSAASQVARAARAEDRLRILLRVSQLLSSPVPLDALLERILELLFQVLPVDRAAILLGEGDAGALEPKAVRSRQPLEPGERFYSQSIVRYVREHSVAAVFNDAQADSRLRDAPSVYRQSIRSSMCAPLKPKSVVLGVLYVDNQSLPGGFGEGDVEFLGAFANQAAIAIDNARLYERIEQDAVLRSNFLRFFPPNAARRILDAKEQALGVIDTEVTALFCDISGFTALSSQMAPRAVVELLNEYFPVMSEIVFRHEGTLEKYIGDALLAVWGAPFAQPDDVDRAIRAGIEMHRAIGRLNERRAQKGQFSIGIHIGVNTGPVAAGNIGSDRYLQYATIGDTTNVASRICGAAGDGELVIAAATAGRWKERHAPIEPLQAVVKGKAEPLELYRVRWDLVR